MTRRLLAVLLAMVAVLSACGDDEEKTGSSSGSGTKAEEAAAPRTEAELEALLLTQADVPTGLTLQPDAEEEEEEAASGEGCLEQDVDAVIPPAAKATAEFGSADQFKSVSHEIRSYKDDDAEKSMEEGRKQLEACRTFEQTDEEGTLKGSFEDLDFPDLGDDTVAVTIKATVGEIAVTGDFVVVRKGNETTTIGNLVIAGTVDHAVTRSLAEKAVAKLG
jgi:hypothetical protein